MGAGAGSDRGAGVGLLEQSLKVESAVLQGGKGGEGISEENGGTPLGRWKHVLHWKAHQQKFGFGCLLQLDQESLE